MFISLRDKWVPFMVAAKITPASIEQFDHELTETLRSFHTLALQKPEVEFDDLFVSFKEDKQMSRPFYKARSRFVDVRSQYMRLTNERKQYDWGTTIDHVKNWIYRTVTAITIATIILGTAVVADRLNIDIPLIRIG